MTRHILCLILWASLLPSALANVGVIRKTPTTVEGPWVAQTPVVVESEELTFTFTKEGDNIAAQFEATYFIVNPTEAQETIVGTFFAPNGAIQTAYMNTFSGHGRETITSLQPAIFFLDGKELKPYIPSGEESAAIQKRLEESDFLSTVPVDPRVTPTSQRFYLGEEELANRQALEAIHQQERIKQALRSSGSFQIVLAPGQKATLKATGRLEGGYSAVNAYSKEALYARHSLMGPEKPPSRDFQFFYALSPIRTWSGSPSIQVTLHYPSSWETNPYLMSAEPLWKTTTSEESSTKKATLSAEQATMLSMDVSLPERVQKGGLFLGAGRLTNAQDSLQLRVGYELSLREFLFVGGVLETNAANRLTVSPLFSVAAPTAFIFPSFGAGVGVPLQVAEGQVSVGARLQLDAMLGPVGVVVPIDVFPGSQDRLQISVMGQLSL